MQQDFDDVDHFTQFGGLEVDNQGGFTDEDLPETWMHPRHGMFSSHSSKYHLQYVSITVSRFRISLL